MTLFLQESRFELSVAATAMGEETYHGSFKANIFWKCLKCFCSNRQTELNTCLHSKRYPISQSSIDIFPCYLYIRNWTCLGTNLYVSKMKIDQYLFASQLKWSVKAADVRVKSRSKLLVNVKEIVLLTLLIRIVKRIMRNFR